MKDAILEYISNLENLPTLPEVSLEIMKTLQKADVSLSEAVQSIRKDPSLVILIMKVANSARYGGTMKVTALEVAAGRLGISLIRRLALVDGVMSIFPSSRGGYETRKYWEHSLCTSFISEMLLKRLAQEEVPPLPKTIECFTASILHGIGLLILELGFPSSTYQVAETCKAEERPLIDVEMEILGMSYPECGELLCQYWTLPEQVCDTIRWHYLPPECPEISRSICEIIYMSKYIALHQSQSESVFCKSSLEFHEDVFKKYKLDTLSEEEMTDLADKALENSLSII